MTLLSKMAKAQGDTIVKDFILKGLHLTYQFKVGIALSVRVR